MTKSYPISNVSQPARCSAPRPNIIPKSERDNTQYPALDDIFILHVLRGPVPNERVYITVKVARMAKRIYISSGRLETDGQRHPKTNHSVTSRYHPLQLL